MFCVAFSVIADRVYFAYKYRQEEKKKEYMTSQRKNKEDTKSTTWGSEIRELFAGVV